MNSQALIHHLVATQLRIDETSITDADGFDELGLAPLDLVLVVLRLEDFDRGEGNFPLGALEDAKTVGDLVTVLELWVHGQTPGSVEVTNRPQSAVS